MRYTLLISIFLFEHVVGMNFIEIVRENSCAPDKIVMRMEELCRERTALEDVASAFLDNFGGDNFQPRPKPKCKNYSQELRSQLREAALLIGRDMRKLGEGGVDEASLRALNIAKRFMEFAESNSHYFFDGDISESFAVNELISMIDAREKYLTSVRLLKDDMETKKGTMNNDSEDISACLSDSDSES